MKTNPEDIQRFERILSEEGSRLRHAPWHKPERLNESSLGGVTAAPPLFHLQRRRYESLRRAFVASVTLNAALVAALVVLWWKL